MSVEWPVQLRHRAISVAIAAIAFSIAGCSASVPGIATRVEIPPVRPRPTTLDLTSYALALNRIVDKDRLRPRPLVESQPLLDEFLAQAAVIGPETTAVAFPDRNSRLAYVLNCHTACLLRSLMAVSTEATVPETAPIGFEGRFAFMIDGSWRTPAQLRAWATRMAGEDWRVAFSLVTVTTVGPPIVRRPFLPEMLDAQLDRAVRDALASPRVVLIDHGATKRILLWRDLWTMRARLVSDYERRMETTDARMLNVLLEWAETGFQRVTLNSAVGYAERPMPADAHIPWTEVMTAVR